MGSFDRSVLSLGASHLSLCRFSKVAGRGLILNEVLHQPISSDPAFKEQWVGLVESGLKQLSTKTALRSTDLVILPTWVVLSKLLRVTRIEGEGQREVVRFEASSALPNGLEGLEWTYTILDDDGFERDVLVQAVDAKLLESLLNVLRQQGVRPSRIDALTATELTALKAQYASEEGASMLLDLGARSVSLSIQNPGAVPFLRTFNFGGNLVTQALAAQRSLSFPEAERAKLEWIRSPGGGGNLDMLNHASEGFVNRLVSEVQRSLALYRRQGQSGNPARILLTGGASQLPGLADFLERKTGISTLLYDPFRNVLSGPHLSMSQTGQVSYALLPAVGGASTEPGLNEGVANLLPDALSSQLQFSQKKPWLAAAAALFLLAGLVVGLKYHMQAWDVENRRVSLEAELAPLESLSGQIKSLHETYKRLTATTEAKQRILQHEHHWVTFLADMQSRLNQVRDVWLESIAEEDTDGPLRRLRVTGRLLDRENPLSLVSSNSRDRVEVLLGSFENSPFIQSVEDRRFDTSRPGILRFDFSLVVNTPVSL